MFSLLIIWITWSYSSSVTKCGAINISMTCTTVWGNVWCKVWCKKFYYIINIKIYNSQKCIIICALKQGTNLICVLRDPFRAHVGYPNFFSRFFIDGGMGLKSKKYEKPLELMKIIVKLIKKQLKYDQIEIWIFLKIFSTILFLVCFFIDGVRG